MAGFNFKKLVNDSSDRLKTGAQKAQEAAKNIDYQAVKNEAASKGKAAADYLNQKKADMAKAASEAAAKKKEGCKYITIKGALQLMSLVMAADGEIADEELTELRDIGNELEPKFAEYHEILIEECIAKVKGLEQEELHDALHDAVRDILDESLYNKNVGIPVKLLIWYLLAVANSDGSYTDEETRLIKYIAKRIGVDESIVPEMENAARAFYAVENEVAWLKTSDRPFGVVEPVMNELSDRKAAIMQGVQLLIDD